MERETSLQLLAQVEEEWEFSTEQALIFDVVMNIHRLQVKAMHNIHTPDAVDFNSYGESRKLFMELTKPREQVSLEVMDILYKVLNEFEDSRVRQAAIEFLAENNYVPEDER